VSSQPKPIRLSRFGWWILLSAIAQLFLLARVSPAATTDEIIQAAKKEREIEVYATLGIEDATGLVTRFEEKYPFLKVKLTRADTEKLLTRVLLEARARRQFADVIQTVAFSMHAFVKKGILGSYVSSEDRFYLKDFKGPDLLDGGVGQSVRRRLQHQNDSPRESA